MINISDIHMAQSEWADEVIRLGRLGGNHIDLRHEAETAVDRLYAYGLTEVMFKPTKAFKIPFRTTRDAAISYFIGANPGFPEDTGFALKPWKSILFNNAQIRIDGDSAAAMGHYTFGDYSGEELMVEYSFGYLKTRDERLKIWLHHSSIPFSG